jgi:hypothetical protein
MAKAMAHCTVCCTRPRLTREHTHSVQYLKRLTCLLYTRFRNFIPLTRTENFDGGQTHILFRDDATGQHGPITNTMYSNIRSQTPSEDWHTTEWLNGRLLPSDYRLSGSYFCHHYAIDHTEITHTHTYTNVVVTEVCDIMRRLRNNVWEVESPSVFRLKW